LRFNLNPVKASLQIFSLLKSIEANWKKSQLRTSKLTSLLSENTQKYLGKRYFPHELSRQVVQTDIFGNNALTYFEKFDAYKILETSVIDGIMIDLWNSKLDTSGDLLNDSTGYNIIIRAMQN